MIDRARLRALAEAATPGPWYVGALDRHGQRIVRSDHIEIASFWHHCVGAIEKEMESNSRFTAAAREAIPALLDALAAAERERGEAQDHAAECVRREWAAEAERDAAERERDRLDAALRASCIDAREELREMGGGCSRAVAAEAERDALAALLRTIKPILVTVREGSVPLDAPLASLIAEIDALDGAKGK